MKITPSWIHIRSLIILSLTRAVPAPKPGDLVPLPPNQKGISPLRVLESRAILSIVEMTCIKAYKEVMEGTDEAYIEADVLGGYNWCEPLDETPTPADNHIILTLIRMRLIYTGPLSKNNKNRQVYFYILATRSLDAKAQRGMTILSIVPRIPCIALHKEAVANIQVYIPGEYFTLPGPNGDRLPGCHDHYLGEYKAHIYLSRIIFTGSHSKHLFLYGSRLVQSNDGGRTFVSLRDVFPDPIHQKSAQPAIPEIETMAFDNEGHYAFLTNEKELYIGSTGDVRQIRIRPSAGYSMMQTMPSDDEEMEFYDDGATIEPISIMYDDDDVLYEVVVITEDKKAKPRVATRRIPIDFILRFQKLFDKLNERAVEKEPDFTNETPSKWSLYCPATTVVFYENYVKGVTVLDMEPKEIEFDKEEVEPEPKTLTTEERENRLHQDNDHPGLWAINVAIENVDWKVVSRLASSTHETSSYNPEQFDRWVLQKKENAKISHLRFVSDDKLDSKSRGNRLLSQYFLDYGTTLRIELTFEIKSDAVVGDRDFQSQTEDKVQLNVDNPNGTLLEIDTEKISLTAQAAVKFIIHISVSRSEFLTQYVPGEGILSFHIIFHLIEGFGRCVKRLAEPFSTESLSTNIKVGCRPSTDILFNWNQTLYSIKFKDKFAHYGRGDDCYNNEFVCFFARAPLILFFDIYDAVKQSYVAYTGNYVLRIIAGGYSKDSLEDYSVEKQHGYNIPGVSDVSLIWNEWDIKTNSKIERPIPHYDPDAKADVSFSSRERVLKAGVSAIQWACHTLSPCARVVPNSAFQTIFWFRFIFSNRGIENNTLCLYEKEFDIMLYGFPPSPETQLFTTIIFCLCMLGILYLLFICLRSHKKVWRAARLKMSGWYLIVRDTFPKGLKTHEEQNPDEILSQQQKDNIILSLQGHLKIPPLVGRHSVVPSPGATRRSGARDSTMTRNSSQMSLESGQSVNPDQNADPSTWTDMVYEQIISKRLAAIVDKNKKMRANIMRRTSLHDKSIEQEKRYEQEHKKTIDEEFSGKPGKKD